MLLELKCKIFKTLPVRERVKNLELASRQFLSPILLFYFCSEKHLFLFSPGSLTYCNCTWEIYTFICDEEEYTLLYTITLLSTVYSIFVICVFVLCELDRGTVYFALVNNQRWALTTTLASNPQRCTAPTVVVTVVILSHCRCRKKTCCQLATMCFVWILRGSE